MIRRPSATAAEEALLLGLFNSLVFDWYVRRWVELHLTFTILNSAPFPEPEGGGPFREKTAELAARLSAKDSRFEEWADEAGVPVASLVEPSERAAAMAELDALAALLYGLDWDDVVHIFETFHRGWDYTGRLAVVRVHYDRWSSEV